MSEKLKSGDVLKLWEVCARNSGGGTVRSQLAEIHTHFGDNAREIFWNDQAEIHEANMEYIKQSRQRRLSA